MTRRALPLGALLFSFALGAGAAPIEDLIDAGWRVQRRWTAVSANGSFVYDFVLRAWNGAGKLKESITRTVRVSNHGGAHDSVILSATKNGTDETESARAEERRRAGAPEPKPRNDFPSPFDPQFRGRYAFAETEGGGGSSVVSFRPRALFDGAIDGRAVFDAGGALRRVEFTLAKRPAFTKRLDFSITMGEAGFPEKVDTSGEVSLVVWKRRFESRLVLEDVRPGGKEKP